MTKTNTIGLERHQNKESTAHEAKNTGFTATDFPIPYVANEPVDDMTEVLALLEVADSMLDDGCRFGLAKKNVADLMVQLGQIRQHLDVIYTYLDDDDRPGTLERYQAARRAHIVQNFERGQA